MKGKSDVATVISNPDLLRYDIQIRVWGIWLKWGESGAIEETTAMAWRLLVSVLALRLEFAKRGIASGRLGQSFADWLLNQKVQVRVWDKKAQRVVRVIDEGSAEPPAPRAHVY